MDILVITWNFPPRRGWIEQLLAGLCDTLSKNHRLFIITAYAAPSCPATAGIFRPRWPGLWAFFSYALWKGALLLRCSQEIRVVFGGSVLVTPLVLILARLFRRKCVVQSHGLDLLYPKLAYQCLIVWWLRFCDHVIANSNYTAGLAKDKGASNGSITVIPPGVHWQKFVLETSADALRSEWDLHGKRIILFVGRLARRKGVKEFIERSLVQTIHKVPEVSFLIVGDNPKDSLIHRDDVRSEIEQAISVCHLEKHVQWLGALNDDDLVKIYNLCDLVVLPVLKMKDDVEGFNIVALEAAAAAKPVVAMSVGGVSDAVEDGKSGIGINAEDYESMSQSIVTLLRDDRTRLSLGEYARNRVKNTFDWSRIVVRYEKVFDTFN